MLAWHFKRFCANTSLLSEEFLIMITRSFAIAQDDTGTAQEKKREKERLIAIILPLSYQ